jgi:hypothetical protein
MPMGTPESRRLTRFPGKDHGRHFEDVDDSDTEDSNSKRRTRFPGSLDQDFTLLSAKSLEESRPERHTKNISVPLPSRIPLTINAPDAAPSRPLKTIKRVKPISPDIRDENPLATYNVLRKVARGSKVQIACTRDTSVPTVMVALKETKVVLKGDFIKFQHQNLVLFLEVYKYENKIMVVSEYMQVSLRQALAIPYEFEEIHISTVCTQVSSLRGMKSITVY